jgi:hypothetical protein
VRWFRFAAALVLTLLSFAASAKSLSVSVIYVKRINAIREGLVERGEASREVRLSKRTRDFPIAIVDFPFSICCYPDRIEYSKGEFSTVALNGKWKIYNGKWQMLFEFSRKGPSRIQHFAPQMTNHDVGFLDASGSLGLDHHGQVA